MSEAAERETNDEPSVEALIGHSLGGRYKLLSVLGHGGMGAVYEAETTDGVRCAVKVILGEQVGRGDARKRFVREARAIRAIDAENVVKILDADTDATEGHPFIAMELLKGRDLDRLVREKGALEPAPVVRAFVQACRGLAAAHARGIVHRDVKPANLFLHEDASGGVTVKVCDFGVAKRLDGEGASATSTANLTQSGGVVGSPMYMSPEQAKSARDIDHRTDVWGIALSLHEALCGERPWKGCTTVGELIVAICTQSMPPLVEVAPWVPSGLAIAVEKGLARSPSDRWPTIEAFAAAIEPFAKGRITIARDDLAGVPATARASGNPRVVIGDSGNVAGSTAHATTLGTTPSNANVATTRRPRTTMWIGTVIAAVVVTGVAVQLSRSSSSPSTSSSAAPVASSDEIVPAQPNGTPITPTPTPTPSSPSTGIAITAPTTPHPSATSIATSITSSVATTKPATSTAKSTTTTAITAPPVPSSTPTSTSTSPKPKDSW
jgi:serine/threonine-protein kinase